MYQNAHNLFRLKTRPIVCLILAVAFAPKASIAAEPDSTDTLVIEQQRVADNYQRLEDVLLRMAEVSALTDPRRAALLRKVVIQSKERLVGVQFESLVELIQNERLSRAIENQQGLRTDLAGLLELLLSENRARRLASEKDRIRDYIKRVDRLIRQQKGIQGRTAGGAEPKGLAEEQGKLADSTEDLAEDIKADEQNGSETESTDGSDSQGDKPEKPPEAERESDGEETPDEKESGDKADEKPDETDSPKDATPGGQPSESQGQGSGQGEKSDQPPKEQQNPAQPRIEAAQERMRQAQRKLDEAQRDGAVEEQEEAVRQLEQARAELEEILRQLREEEIERVLARLEARFIRMLQLQQAVNEETLRLDKVPKPQRDHAHEIAAGRTSSKEAEIVLEADKALNLLREDGTAVAFPEAVEQVRLDMRQVVQRLAQANVGVITQAIEEDIITALEEMIEALQVAQQEAEERRQQPQQHAQQGDPRDRPLVNVLAEIKMIRAMQMRVNTRTERYSKLIPGEQAEAADLLDALDLLAEQQERVFQITRDLHREQSQ